MLRKFNTLARLLIVGLLIYPLPIAMADHVPTQAPYGTNASDDANAGTFTIGILGSDGYEDSPPENYTIFFSQSSGCLLYTSPSPRDRTRSRMPSSA